MTDHILASAKAYAALIGAVCTGLLGIYADGQVGHVLTVLAAIATAVGTFTIPNATRATTSPMTGLADHLDAVPADQIVAPAKKAAPRAKKATAKRPAKKAGA